jgi:hypothetical protein
VGVLHFICQSFGRLGIRGWRESCSNVWRPSADFSRVCEQLPDWASAQVRWKQMKVVKGGLQH